MAVLDHLSGAEAGLDSAVDGAVVTKGVYGFAGEVDCVFHRLREFGLGAETTDRYVTVGAEGKWIGGPVVSVEVD